MEYFEVEKAGALRGRLRIPGDKSISHRALILGALCEGQTDVVGLQTGADVLGTRAALVQMGVGISAPEAGACTLDGVGLHGLVAPLGELDLGNSGTAMRLLAGVLVGQRFPTQLRGDASLTARPMGRIIEPLRAMGARIEGPGQRPPLAIEPAAGLRGIDHEPRVASAQVKSCLLLAGLYAAGRTRVREPLPTRDHTERMLSACGYPLLREGPWVGVQGPQPLRSPGRIEIPGDISSAAFWLVAGSIVRGSDLVLENVGVNPRRTGILDLLRRMGARLEIRSERSVCGEPVADVRVTAAPLRGVTIGPAEVPGAIDEFPALFVAAALARGTTRLSGAEELRRKESDRIAVMARALRALGARVEERADGVLIEGGDRLDAGEVDAAGDHRCAMALAVAGAAGQGCRIRDVANVATSYPEFATHAGGVGLPIERAS